MAEEIKSEPIFPRFTLTIGEDREGNRSMIAFDESKQNVPMVKIRELLHWGITKIDDQITVAYVTAQMDKLLRERLHMTGFRPTSVKDFLVK